MLKLLPALLAGLLVFTLVNLLTPLFTSRMLWGDGPRLLAVSIIAATVIGLIVLLGVLAANWMAGGLLITLTLLTGEFSRLELGAAFWGGLALFSAGTLIAAFAPGRRIVGATLVILLAYHGYQIGRAVLAIVAAGGWSVLGPAAV